MHLVNLVNRGMGCLAHLVRRDQRRGKTWTPITLPQDVTMAEALCMNGSGTGYFVSERKDVFYTADSCAHGEKLANPFGDFKHPYKPLVCRGTQGIAITMSGKDGLGTVDKATAVFHFFA